MSTQTKTETETVGVKWILAVAVIAVVVVGGLCLKRPVEGAFWATASRMKRDTTVEQRLNQCGQKARARLAPGFGAAGVAYPPERVVFVGIKQDRTFEVWAGQGDGPLRRITTYPILGASGHLGPKLQEGDRQVPEGIYRIESLHPNSWFHLALRVGYPNEFDKRHGQEDGREHLGGDIMIHGGSGSVGCVAVGDDAAEDLFVLAADTGIENITLILTPVDFRAQEKPESEHPLPPWSDTLYADIRHELAALEP